MGDSLSHLDDLLLTSYQLILSVPKSHHKKTGALLVGNPCLKELEETLHDLPCAQKEVESIVLTLNTIPLIGRQATKADEGGCRQLA